MTGANRQPITPVDKTTFTQIKTFVKGHGNDLTMLQAKFQDVDKANLKFIAGMKHGEGYKAYSKWAATATTATAKFGKALGSIAKTAGSMFVSAGLNLLIGYAIQGLFTLTDHLITTKAEWKEMAEAAQESFKEANEQIKETENLVEEVRDKYFDLAKEVNLNTGDNLSLSNDEYTEFLQISNQLAETFPTLTRTYDENGNAIVNLGDSAGKAAMQLQELVEAEKTAALMEYEANFESIFTDAKNDISNIIKDIHKAENQINRLEPITQKLFKFDENGVVTDFNDFSQMTGLDATEVYLEQFFQDIKKAGYEVLTENTAIGISFRGITKDGELISEQERKSLAQKYSATMMDIVNEAERDLAVAENKKASKDAVVSGALVRTLGLDKAYQEMDAELQAVVRNVVGNIEITDALNHNEAQNFVDEITTLFANTDDTKLQEVLSDLFVLEDDNVKKTSNDYLLLIDKLRNNILSLFDDEEQGNKVVEAMLGAYGLDDVETNIKDTRARVAETTGLTEKMVSSLSYDRLMIAEQVAMAEMSMKELNDAIDQYLKQNVDFKIKVITPKTTISNMEKLSDTFDKFASIWNDVKDGGEFDYSAIIDSDFIKQFEDYAVEYENFIAAVSASPANINNCQQAFNNLVGAWLLGSDTLQELDESNADLTIAMLKDKGVANASEIVHNRLAAAREYEAKASKAKGSALLQEIAGEVNLQEELADSEKCLVAYALEKEIANGVLLDTTADITNLMNLVKALGGTTDALVAYAEFKAHYDRLVAGNASEDILSGTSGRLAQLRAAAEASIQSTLNAQIGTNTQFRDPKTSGSSDYYDTYAELLQDKENFIQQFITKDEILTQQYEEAVRNNNQELAESLVKQISDNKSVLEKAYQTSSDEIKSVLNGEILPAIFNIAPQLAGVDIEDWSEVVIKDISENLSDAQQTIFDSLVSSAKAMNEAAGANGEWAKAKFAIPSEIDNSYAEFYGKVLEWDQEIIEAKERQTQLIEQQIDALDKELQLLETQKEMFEDSAFASDDTATILKANQREYSLYITKLKQLESSEASIADELSNNEQLLRKYKTAMSSLRASGQLGAETEKVLSDAIKDTTDKINDNKAALQDVKQARYDYYNDLLSQIKDNLREIYNQKYEKAQDALNKKYEDMIKPLEDQISALEEKKKLMDDINELLELELELQGVLRDTTATMRIDEFGNEVYSHDLQREKELRAEIEDLQSEQAHETRVELWQSEIDALEKSKEEELEVLEKYYDKVLSDYAINQEALRLVQEHGYEKALIGTSNYLNELEKQFYEAEPEILIAGERLTESLVTGMFENLDSYLTKFSSTIKDTYLDLSNYVTGLTPELTIGANVDKQNVIAQMKANSEAWAKATTQAERDWLASENQRLGASIGAKYNDASGTWYSDQDETRLLYNELSDNVNATNAITPVIDHAKAATIKNTNTIGGNTFTVQGNTIAIENSTGKFTYAIDELISNEDAIAEELGVSANELVEAVLTLRDSVSDISLLSGGMSNGTSVSGLGDEDGDGLRDTYKYDVTDMDKLATDTSHFRYDQDKRAFISDSMTITGVGSTEEANRIRRYLQTGSYDGKGDGTGSIKDRINSSSSNQYDSDISTRTYYTFEDENGNRKTLHIDSDDYRTNRYDNPEMQEQLKELGMENAKLVDSYSGHVSYSLQQMSQATNKDATAVSNNSIAVKDASNALYTAAEGWKIDTAKLGEDADKLDISMNSLGDAVSEGADQITDALANGIDINIPTTSTSSGSSSKGKTYVKGSNADEGYKSPNDKTADTYVDKNGVERYKGSNNRVQGYYKHDGLESGFLGGQMSLSDKMDYFRKVALGEIKLKDNEVPFIGLKNEGILTVDQMNNISDFITGAIAGNGVKSQLKRIDPSSFMKTTSQNIDNSRHFHINGMTVKSDNVEQFVKQLEILDIRNK